MNEAQGGALALIIGIVTLVVMVIWGIGACILALIDRWIYGYWRPPWR